jgi:hypothetical protein
MANETGTAIDPGLKKELERFTCQFNRIRDNQKGVFTSANTAVLRKVARLYRIAWESTGRTSTILAANYFNFDMWANELKNGETVEFETPYDFKLA